MRKIITPLLFLLLVVNVVSPSKFHADNNAWYGAILGGLADKYGIGDGSNCPVVCDHCMSFNEEVFEDNGNYSGLVGDTYCTCYSGSNCYCHRYLGGISSSACEDSLYICNDTQVIYYGTPLAKIRESITNSSISGVLTFKKWPKEKSFLIKVDCGGSWEYHPFSYYENGAVIEHPVSASIVFLNYTLKAEGKTNHIIISHQPITQNYSELDVKSYRVSISHCYCGYCYVQYLNITNIDLPYAYAEKYTAIKPYYLDTLVYIYSRPDTDYGIFIEYNGTKYLIAGGLPEGEGFYTDLGLKHYVKCDLLDVDNDTYIPIYPTPLGGVVYFDIASVCRSSMAYSAEATSPEQVLGCGHIEVHDNGDGSKNISFNTTQTLLITYLPVNKSVFYRESVITTGDGEVTTPSVNYIRIVCLTDNGGKLSIYEWKNPDWRGQTIPMEKTVGLLVGLLLLPAVMFATRNIGVVLGLGGAVLLVFNLLGMIPNDILFVFLVVIAAFAFLTKHWGDGR